MRALTFCMLFAFLLAFFGFDVYAQLPMDGSYDGEDFDVMGTGTTLPPNWRSNRSPSRYRITRSWNDSDPNVSASIDAYPLDPQGDDFSFNCGHVANGSNRSLCVRPRQSAYSGSYIAWFQNNTSQTITTVHIGYTIEKFRKDINPTGTEIAIFYSYSANADFPTADGGMNPATSWMQVIVPSPPSGWLPPHSDGPDVVPTHFPADLDTDGNGGPTIPFWGVIIPDFDITGLDIPPNGDFFLAICFSPGDPTNSGGNNAQNSQAFSVEQFNFGPGPLPVELATFSGVYRNGKIDLKWKTETEANNFGFDVERSADNGRSWTTIGFVLGHGTVSTPQDYAFTDATAFKGLESVSYRLRQVDRDGSFEYYQTLNIALSDISGIKLRNYPNPFNPSTSISFTLPEADVVSVRILDEAGKEIATVLDWTCLDAGMHVISYTATDLASGNYHYELVTSSGVYSNRMTLTK